MATKAGFRLRPAAVIAQRRITLPAQTATLESDRQQLGVWDSVSIIVGIVIGVGIHETAPTVFAMAGSAGMAMAFWVAGGVISLLGALCYAELASTYPRSGGEYCYLTNAYGRTTGFLFGWSQLTVVRTGNVGMMSFIFAEYAAKLWGLSTSGTILLAIAAPLTFSIINILGVVIGKRTQNGLTILKLIGFGLIAIAGLFFGGENSPVAPSTDTPTPMLGLAMLFVLFTYGGWNDAVLVTSEIRDRRRSIVRALIIGVAIITGVYLLVNAAYLNALGYHAAQQSDGIAAECLRLVFGETGARIMSVIVMVSALGAVNGIIFTGARIYATMGEDHRFFAWLSRWHPKLGTPVWSLGAESAITITLILVLGTEAGRGLIDALLRFAGWSVIEWSDRPFNNLFQWCAPFFWIFFLLATLALFVLRIRDPKTERPFRVPLFPLTPGLFSGVCAWCLYSSITYAGKLVVLGFIPVFVGLVVCLLSPKSGLPPSSGQ